jgi:DNA replication protein DnaC
MTTTNNLLEKAKELKFYGILEHNEEIGDKTELLQLLFDWEETARANRSLKHRLHGARLGRFKPIALFDWSWPKKCDRELIEELMKVTFLKEATNIILCGPNGAGKSTIACNIAHQAILQGYTSLFTTASAMLKELDNQDGAAALRRRIEHYTKPTLLVIDEIGYLSYSNRYADLLFEIVSQRYTKKSTLITTNKTFSEWQEIFPNASCLVSLIDRLIHDSEITSIEADSYRLKEANERAAKRKEARATARAKAKLSKKDTSAAN